jgi:HK97 family phage major capsid protein
MITHELTDKINQISSHFEQMKAQDKDKDRQIEKKGAADPVTLAQMEKLSHSIDALQASVHRPYSDVKSVEIADNKEYKNAFCSYLRKGNESGLSGMEVKYLSTDKDSDGGYLVTPQMSNEITKVISETSPMRQICKVQQISGDALEIIEDTEEAFAGWTLETELRSETNTPQIGKRVIPVHELYAQPKATQKLIDDSSVDIENWLSEKLVDVFSRKENAAFINGDGQGKPRGILSYEAGKEWGKIEQILSGENASITADGIINLYYSLKEIYAVKSKFLMSRAAVQAVRMLKDTTNGKYLWQPSLTAGTPDTLLGAEVIQAADMPALTQNSLAIAFGDFHSAYQIVDRQGIRVLRDPFTEKPFVKFYTTKRVGGDVVNFEALKLLKLSA